MSTLILFCVYSITAANPGGDVVTRPLAAAELKRLDAALRIDPDTRYRAELRRLCKFPGMKLDLAWVEKRGES